MRLAHSRASCASAGSIPNVFGIQQSPDLLILNCLVRIRTLEDAFSLTGPLFSANESCRGYLHGIKECLSEQLAVRRLLVSCLNARRLTRNRRPDERRELCSRNRANGFAE